MSLAFDRQLVIDGYIREIEGTLQNANIIPSEISMICMRFYDSFKLMILIQENSIELSLLDYCNINHQNWQFNVLNINNDESDSLFMKNNKTIFEISSTAMCSVSNISLPKYIYNELNNSYNSYNSYSAIFQCGGEDHISYESTNCCNVAIWNQDNLSIINDDIINAYNYRLAEYPYCIEQNQLLFCYNSKYYGLYCIDIDNIYYLSFKNDAEQEWNKLNVAKRKRNRGQIVFIDNDSKLMIISGDDMSGINATSRCTNYVEMIDLENDNKSFQLNNINQSRIEGGVTFNKYKNYIYIVGGYNFDTIGSLNKAEYYDINKNKWINLPNTNNVHDYYPIIWTEDSNLLYVTSTNEKIVEFIDLRQNNKTWCNIHHHIKLENVFKSISVGSFIDGRLLC